MAWLKWLRSLWKRLWGWLFRGPQSTEKSQDQLQSLLTVVMEGGDPCQIYVDRLEDLALQLDALILLIQAVVADLMRCRDEHPETPPMGPLSDSPVYSWEYKVAVMSKLIDDLKTLRKMIR